MKGDHGVRSLLFVPGHDTRKLAKSLESGADALILDLEDAVPEREKARARETCSEFIRANRHRIPLFVRVNALTSGLMLEDLASVIGAQPHGVMVPKCQNGADLDRVDAYVSALEVRESLVPDAIRLLPIVTETAASMFGLGTYAYTSCTRLCGMMWGGEDLSADVGASGSRRADGSYSAPYELARSLCLFGASASKVEPIDAVYTDFGDREGLQRECIDALRDGFTAKVAIHPAQIDVINDIFTPSREELEKARMIVDAFASSPGSGAISLGGKMLDRPHLRSAERILARSVQLE